MTASEHFRDCHQSFHPILSSVTQIPRADAIEFRNRLNCIGLSSFFSELAISRQGACQIAADAEPDVRADNACKGCWISPDISNHVLLAVEPAGSRVWRTQQCSQIAAAQYRMRRLGCSRAWNPPSLPCNLQVSWKYIVSWDQVCLTHLFRIGYYLHTELRCTMQAYQRRCLEQRCCSTSQILLLESA